MSESVLLAQNCSVMWGEWKLRDRQKQGGKGRETKGVRLREWEMKMKWKIEVTERAEEGERKRVGKRDRETYWVS